MITYRSLRFLVVLLMLSYGAFTLFMCFSGFGVSQFYQKLNDEPTLPLGVRVNFNRHPKELVLEGDTVVYKKQPGVKINKATDVTILIKTMDRPHCVRKLIFDIHENHPNLTILVADDGEFPSWTDKDDGIAFVKYFRMPHDSGQSAGRNLMLSQVQTPYLLLLDDDFVWDSTVFIQFVYVMENHPYLDLVGGRAGLHFAGFMHEFNSTIFLLRGKHGILEGTDNLQTDKSVPGTPCEVVEFVPNFFLARTDTIMSLQWHNKLKIGEHEEFFYRFNKAKYKAAFCSDITLLDQQSKCTEGFVEQSWDRIYDIPDSVCYEVPLPKDCPAGWTGERCEECVSKHFGPHCKACDCHHGTCVVNQNSNTVECACTSGWVGDKCQDRASYSLDLIQDPSFSSISVENSGKWFAHQDGCISFAKDGIWLINDGQLSCGAGYRVCIGREHRSRENRSRLEINQTAVGLIAVSGQSISVGVKNLEDAAMYSVYIDITFSDDTMQYGYYLPFTQGTHELETKELVLAPPKPVKRMLIYVLLRNAYGSVYFQNVTVRVNR